VTSFSVTIPSNAKMVRLSPTGGWELTSEPNIDPPAFDGQEIILLNVHASNSLILYIENGAGGVLSNIFGSIPTTENVFVLALRQAMLLVAYGGEWHHVGGTNTKTEI